VQVTDKSGAPIRGLQKKDFTLLDDKQPQNILSFHAVDRRAKADWLQASFCVASVPSREEFWLS
jgi:hypothetical protein